MAYHATIPAHGRASHSLTLTPPGGGLGSSEVMQQIKAGLTPVSDHKPQQKHIRHVYGNTKVCMEKNTRYTKILKHAFYALYDIKK